MSSGKANLSEDEYQEMLFSLENASSVDRKRTASALMRLVSVHLQSEQPLPRNVRDWLSASLARGSGGNADLAFGLKSARGGQQKLDRKIREHAYVYALTSWGWTQSAAAERVAAFLNNSGEEVAIKKRSNSVKKVWITEGPFLMFRDEREPPEATQRHLEEGRLVAVEISSPGRTRCKAIWLDKRVLGL